MALLKQYRKGLDEGQVKNLLMAGAKTIDNQKKETYSPSRQGAGLVDLYKTLTTTIQVSPAAISLGDQRVEGKKTLLKKVKFTNILSTRQKLSLQIESSRSIKVQGPSEVVLTPGEEASVDFLITLEPQFDSYHSQEAYSFVNLIKKPLQ